MNEKNDEMKKKMSIWGNKLAIKMPTKKKSVGDRLNEARQRESEQVNEVPNRIALVTDNSGSMAGEPIQKLREACQSFVDNCDFSNTSVAIRTFGLPNEIQRPLSCNRFTVEETISQFAADGGTPMMEALKDVIANVPMTRVVLVSDGFPTDMYARGSDKKTVVLMEDGGIRSNCYDVEWIIPYKEMGIPIDCVHISESKGGEAILKYIANETGGVFIKFKDVGDFATHFKYLAPRYRALLNAPGAASLLGADEFKGGSR